ncbi:PepSY domain-containing protein [Sporosarcina sp. OR05]|uniref:PepSY domain-containing protein n=1 Tax=Sporosarcina sp. OR05 TaxID=2969819 RepID=UPI00352BB239
MNKWMLIPAMAGVIAIGGVAMASDSVPASVASKDQLISLKEAKELAEKKVGGIVTEIELEQEGARYVYEVDAVAKGVEYELHVNALSREVVIVEKSTDTKWTDKMITEEQAVAIAKGMVNAIVKDIELDKDDNLHYYDIELEDEKFEYEVKVDAITSEVIKFDKEALDNDDEHAQPEKLLTKEEALTIAKKKANGTVEKIELDSDDNRKVYEIEIKDDEFEYEIDLDAATGEVLNFEKDRYRTAKNDTVPKVEATKQNVTNHSLQVVQTTPVKQEVKAEQSQPVAKRTKLTKEQVLAIAKQKATGVVTEFELDGNVYEVEMEDGDIEYELKIDAYTGAILSFEKDEE